MIACIQSRIDSDNEVDDDNQHSDTTVGIKSNLKTLMIVL